MGRYEEAAASYERAVGTFEDEIEKKRRVFEHLEVPVDG
jgi:hypothetical protein